MSTNKSRLEALQVLRAIAAGMVVFVHALSTYRDKVDALMPSTFNFGLGELGVKLFFCISGFIIFASTESLQPGRTSFSYFIRRRLIRIAPLYWCATLIYAAKLALQGNAPEGSSLAYSLLFIPFKDAAGLMRPVLGVGWTLNYEMFFYLVLGVALFAPRALRLILVPVAMLALAWARANGLIVEGAGFWGDALYLLSDTYLLFFVVGIFIAPISKLKTLRSFLSLKWHIACGVVVFALIGLVSASSMLRLSSGQVLALEIAVCGMCVLLSVMATSTAEHNSKLRHVVVWAGDGSYSTYLTHGFVMGSAARLLHIFHLDGVAMLYSAGMVILCTFVGMVIFKFFENPLLKKMNAKLGNL
ncbi:acyltransferase [Rhodoferax saidenbachensis]|uniref:Exopolysaccharide production protein ExoZ n=1 Tax=Rhodoferax saidenbachensis TaxID=1484693 RepID=A0ABU1ZJA2_9BURK|nr:acyltransferase [Rhodoferax saidenbachensis]MDR7305624.1 exopolysaccharide production protein ExoZ [Rhodoferax saidenbachensis]